MPITVTDTEIEAIKIITPRRIGDHRGYFTEVFNAREFAAAGLPTEFVQDNQSLSGTVDTVRGLHFQIPPFAQGKLVRCLRGAFLDVVVDMRHGSPTFARHVSIEVSAELGNQVWVPPGFAHGLRTLEPDTEVHYKVTAYYSPEHDRGVLWNDPALAIAWGTSEAAATLSVKDRSLPRLAELPIHFRYRDGRLT
ncbi:MAG: dTDP-4-dehydrorhamnose 3,5-epimerase [Rhizobiales bacterium]|nr:dTDP-4-dehydrorhamnose 3,5-epimerase [Hyphomicrobiales bacterium]